MKKRDFYILFLLLIPILVIIISRSFSIEYTQEIRSIQIESDNYNQPGSWKITKSVEWTGFGKARVTFDVSSVGKNADGRYKDVILIIDI